MCRKPWQTFHNFFYQFGNPNGGIIFDAMTGLCSTGQMALELGNWDVIAFEKDEATWKLACDVIRNHIVALDSREKTFANQVTSQVEVIETLAKAKKSGFDSLDDDEVIRIFTLFIVHFFIESALEKIKNYP